MTEQELRNRMAVLMGGRAAERMIYGRISTGAADDIVRATNIAREMVTRFGMDPRLGNVSYDDEPQSFLGPALPRARNFSEESARQIDFSVRELVDAAMARAYRILSHNKRLLEDSARGLLAKETLTESDLKPIFDRVRMVEGEADEVAAQPLPVASLWNPKAAS